MINIESLIHKHKKTIHAKIQSKLPSIRSEEDLRIAFVKSLDSFCEACELDFDGNHEVPLGKGRIDSVYSYVFIEFKKPGRIGDSLQSAGSKEVVKQIKDRFNALASEQKEAKVKRYFAVGTDGKSYIFARYKNGDVEVGDPISHSEFAIETVLRKISSCGNGGRALTSENLASDFSIENNDIVNSIKSFYYTALNSKHPKTVTFIQQWMLHFSEVCGYDIEKPGEGIRELCQSITGNNKRPELILFALHTYYSIFIKLLAAEILHYLHNMGSFLTQDVEASKKHLRDKIHLLERGAIFKEIGIKNLLEGDLFSWYVDDWNDDISESVRGLVKKLNRYEMASIGVDFASANDLLKDLYEKLIPKYVRHSSGEYYTPDWLAEHVIAESGFTGEAGKRLLDPSCGSGTFLVEAINRKIQNQKQTNDVEAAREILSSVVGFDLNPIAVISARVNYLIAIFPYLRDKNMEIEIPIYLTDSILTPCYKEIRELTHILRFQTAAGDFFIPKEIIKKDIMPVFCEQLEEAVKAKLSNIDLWKVLSKKFDLSDHLKSDYLDLYQKLLTLDKERRNGVWARIIKNMFAPVLNGKFDFVCGNPPWVRWGYLPDAYRDATKHIWEDYGLFSLSGKQAQLSGGEKDISQLFSYVCIDHYLKDGGILAFLITQSVFRAKGQADGFRRFQLGDREYFRVRQIDDLVEIKPFDGVGNKTVFFVAEKGSKTKYPVSYNQWSKKKNVKYDVHSSLKHVLNCVQVKNLQAQPGGKKEASFLQVSSKAGSTTLKCLHGSSSYKPLRGAGTDPYAVYQFESIQKAGDGYLIKNRSKGAKKKAKTVQKNIEGTFIYPFIEGSDIETGYISGNSYGLMVQDINTRMAVEKVEIAAKSPKTLSYLCDFENILKSRKSKFVKQLMSRSEFYSMYGISKETISDWKVVWRRMGDTFKCAILGPCSDKITKKKKWIPTDTVAFLALRGPKEALYTWAILTSSIFRWYLNSVSTPGRGYAPPSVVGQFNLGAFKSGDRTHRNVVRSAVKFLKLLYSAKNKSDWEKVQHAFNNLELCVGEVYGISIDQLEKMKQELPEKERKEITFIGRNDRITPSENISFVAQLSKAV
ncbi:N-6 DNA methylase [Bdellovibrio sp. HCB-162]|uniref:N-6 DNA methylase n=1 Tax=Bdellovibrio sp. HCB-162 TaxID=3394234 RepID=UPI0039BC350F